MALLERHADLPAGAGEFHRIGYEVHNDLLEAPGIADQRDLHVRVHVHDELDAARMGVVQGYGTDVMHHVVQHERGLFKFKVPGLDLRYVEQIIDDFKKRPRGLEDGPEVAVRRGLFLEQGKFGKGHDAVQGRADFVADVGEELAFRGRGGVGGFLGELELGVDGLQVARALVDAVFQFHVGLLQHGPAFPKLLFGTIVFGQFLIELGRPARYLPLEGKVPVKDKGKYREQHFRRKEHHPDGLFGEGLLFIRLEPLLGNDPALFLSDFAERLVDDAVEFGPVLADAEGMSVRRVDGAGDAEVADAAVVDFFRNIELVVDHGVDFAEGDFLQPLQRVFDGHGHYFRVQFLKEIMPRIPVDHRDLLSGQVLDPLYVRFRFARGRAAGHEPVLGGLPGHDDAGEHNVGGREQHILGAVLRLRRGDVHIHLVGRGHVRRVAPVGGGRDAEGEPRHLVEDTEIVRADAGIAAFGVEFFQRVEIGIDADPDSVVLAEPQAFLMREIVGNGFLPFHDGIHRIDVPVEQVVLHGFQDEKNLRRHEKHAEKKDCQQTHANLIQLGVGGGASGQGRRPPSLQKRGKPGTSHVGASRAYYGSYGRSGSVLAEAGKVLMGGCQHVRHEDFPSFGVTFGHGDARGQIVPDAFSHVAGLRLGRQGFHVGFNLGEGFLGLFELVGHEGSSLRKSVSERRL